MSWLKKYKLSKSAQSRIPAKAPGGSRNPYGAYPSGIYPRRPSFYRKGPLNFLTEMERSFEQGKSRDPMDPQYLQQHYQNTKMQINNILKDNVISRDELRRLKQIKAQNPEQWAEILKSLTPAQKALLKTVMLF